MKYIRSLLNKFWKYQMDKIDRENYTDGRFDIKKSWYYTKMEHRRRWAIYFLIFFIGMIYLLLDVLIINKSVLTSKKNDREYKNSHKYFNVRELKYIGGIQIEDANANNIKRWCPLYFDLNTKEILRGANTENYITAGGCKVGIDKIDVLNERNTRRGFQKFVLDYIGGIEYTKSSIDLPDKTYGVSVATQNYNKPIDIIVDKNWNNNKALLNNDIYLISTISEVKNYAINDIILESSGKFTENEYLFNILRNCFGYISDDFYDLVNGNNHFSEIYVHEVRMGDIGTFFDNDGKLCTGICIGFDKKQNPIFALCSSYKKTKVKGLNRHYSFLGNKKNLINGFNFLVIEKKHIIPIFGKQHIFKHYYHTNLPFVDKNFFDIKYENIRYKIEDIDRYNEQALYLFENNKHSNSNILCNKIYDERINRLESREKEAEKFRRNYSIDLTMYKNMNMELIPNIYNMHTSSHNTNNQIISKNENYIISNEIIEKFQKEYYNNQIEELRSKIMENKDKIKGLTVEKAKKYFETENTFLNQVGLQILEDCLSEINNNE